MIRTRKWLSRYVMAVLSICMLYTPSSFAELVTFNFSGYLDTVDADGGRPDDFFVGRRFSGSYTFETTTPDTVDSPYSYYGENALTEMAFSIGSYSLTEQANELIDGGALQPGYYGYYSSISVYNVDVSPHPDFPVSDSYAVRSGFSGFNTTVMEFVGFDLYLVFNDPTASALDSDALLVTPPDLNDFLDAVLIYSFEPTGPFTPSNLSPEAISVTGKIDSISAVPLPMAGWLYAASLVLLSAIRRKSRNS